MDVPKFYISFFLVLGLNEEFCLYIQHHLLSLHSLVSLSHQAVIIFFIIKRSDVSSGNILH